MKHDTDISDDEDDPTPMSGRHPATLRTTRGTLVVRPDPKVEKPEMSLTKFKKMKSPAKKIETLTKEEFQAELRRAKEATSVIGSTTQSALHTLQGIQFSTPSPTHTSKVLIQANTPPLLTLPPPADPPTLNIPPHADPPALNIPPLGPPPIIQEAQEAQEEDVIYAPLAYIPYLPLDVALPRGHRLRFRPDPSDVYDTGNGELFHPGFLSVGGRRRRVAIPGGLVYIRPKHVKIVVKRKSYGTRKELTDFLRGRFPVGGVIDAKVYSSARLPFAALAKLPGTVLITY